MRKLLQRFTLDGANRHRLTLETGARLDPSATRPALTLAEGATEGIARTWIWNPLSVKQWLGFEAEVEHQYIGGAVGGLPALLPVTTLTFRVNDGTDDYYWDGGAWAVTTTEWNTQADLSANLPTFPVTARKLQIVVRMYTTDVSFVPRVTALKVLWLSDVEFLEDILFRSLVPSLRENIRPIADYPIDPGTGGPWASLDLNNYPLETPYNLVDVVEAYDHTADPDHLTNLRAGYDSGTKVVTFTSPIPDGNKIWLRFTYEPEVAVTTSAEYHEVAKVPALVVTDVDEVEMAPCGQHDWIMTDESTGSGTKTWAPMQGDLEMTLMGLTDKAVDAKRLADAMKAFFANIRVVTSAALDRDYSLWLISEYDQRTPPSQADLHSGMVRFRVRDVVFYVRDSVDSTGVLKFLATGDENFTIQEA
jgi:hypothetical protein